MGILSKYHEIKIYSKQDFLKITRKTGETFLFDKKEINCIIKEKFDEPFVKNDFKIILKNKKNFIIPKKDVENIKNIKFFLSFNDCCVKSDKILLNDNFEDGAHHYKIGNKDIYFFDSSIIKVSFINNAFNYELYNGIKICLNPSSSELLTDSFIKESVNNSEKTEKNWNISLKICKLKNFFKFF